ncbi:LysE family translocator [Muricoccus radiodurans]|uniref:LysE family translocator n=1 Tax=Muricoccus radiodurans TaxID=2231721 RepID=UPI003CEBA8BA
MTGEGVAWLISAVAFAFSMTATPGPNNTMLTASGATFGFMPTVPHMLGISFGFPAMLLAMALGAGEVLRAAPWLYGVLRWAGAAYLLWLAWRIATARPQDDQGQATGRPLSFLQAALFQWVNPKAWVIVLGAAVTYTTGRGAAPWVQAVVLAVIFVLVTLPVTAFWTAVGVGVARVLRTARARRLFNIALAGLLVASLVPVLVGD